MDKFQRHVLFIAVSVLLTVVTDARRTPLGCTNSRWLMLPSTGFVSATAPRSGVYCYRSNAGSRHSWTLSTDSTDSVQICSMDKSSKGPSLELKDCLSSSVRDDIFAVIVSEVSGAKYELYTSPNARRTLVGDVPVSKRDVDCDDEKNKDNQVCQESSGSHHSESSGSESESESDTDDEGGLSKGAIAGIAIGSVLLAGGVVTAGVCLCCVCKSKRKNEGGNDQETDMDAVEEGNAEGELPAPGAPLPAEGIPTVTQGEKFDAKFDKDSDSEAEDSDDESEEDDNDVGAIL